MAKTISLTKEFGENMITRNSIASFFEKKIYPLKEEKVIMDFNKVKFMSRSSAAEYLKLREASDKELIEKNMSDDVKSMFLVVERQFKESDFNFTKQTPSELIGCSG